jgi:hypothetical protein
MLFLKEVIVIGEHGIKIIRVSGIGVIVGSPGVSKKRMVRSNEISA